MLSFFHFFHGIGELGQKIVSVQGFTSDIETSEPWSRDNLGQSGTQILSLLDGNHFE